MTIPAARLKDPSQNLYAAIAILQAQILAADSVTTGDALFGQTYNLTQDTTSIETVLSLLWAVLDVTEGVTWRTQSGGQP